MNQFGLTGHGTPTTAGDILDQTIWFNHNIKRANRTWYFPKAMEAGMIKTRDIYDMNTSKFLSFREVVNKYGNVMTVI